MHAKTVISILIFGVFCACGDDATSDANVDSATAMDGGQRVDAGPRVDAGRVDAPTSDVDGPSPSIDFFRVNALTGSVEVGAGEARVTWQATDVGACTASAVPAVDGWAGDRELSGEQGLVLTESTQLTLTCDALVETVDVVFSLMCDESVFPPGLRMIEGTYSEINDGFPFAESTNASFLLEIPINGFYTLSDFSFPYENARRRIVFVDAPTSHVMMDGGTVSVSECPGDFSDAATCVFSVTNMSTLFFSTRPSEDLDRYCVLDPAKTYFINYVTSTDPYAVPPSCRADGTRCAMFYSEAAL